MKSNQVRTPISWQHILESPICEKFTIIEWQKIFIRLINSDEGQNLGEIEALFSIQKYGWFLYLIQKYPYLKMVPNQEIDAVLHAHIGDANQFQKDCQNLFGAYLQHIPEFGMRGETERLEWQLAFAQTQELFELNFGQGSMGGSPAACCEILLA